ncbi:MAG: hypothetical protein ABFS16_06370 [Bacteroidota bacterium]
MKTRNLIIGLFMALFFSGCVVYSFYPLYTEKDLFPNDILIGDWKSNEWLDNDKAEMDWSFKHGYFGKKDMKNIDSTSYILKLTTREDDVELKSIFSVHIIELGGHYFLDFYLEEEDEYLDLASFHIIPVHTFAKLTVEKDKLIINWFDQEWMEDLIKENRIRIHHEESDDFILLTAKPKELQKFVTKYVNSEEAFKDGLEVILHKK